MQLTVVVGTTVAVPDSVEVLLALPDAVSLLLPVSVPVGTLVWVRVQVPVLVLVGRAVLVAVLVEDGEWVGSTVRVAVWVGIEVAVNCRLPCHLSRFLQRVGSNMVHPMVKAKEVTHAKSRLHLLKQRFVCRWHKG